MNVTSPEGEAALSKAMKKSIRITWEATWFGEGYDLEEMAILW